MHWHKSIPMVLAAVVAWGGVAGCGGSPGERDFREGLRLLEGGRLVRARDRFEKSLQARPDNGINAQAFHYLGWIAWQLEDAGAAEAYWSESHRLNPSLFEPVYSLGVLAFEQGEWDKARGLFSMAADLQPRDPRPLEFMAQTYRGEAAQWEARRVLYQALMRMPHSPRILTALARVEMEEGAHTEAASYLMQALGQDPEYLPALYNLARLYADWPDQQRDAEAYYHQYLQRAPEGERRDEATRALARLRGEAASDPEPAVRPGERDPETPPRAPRTVADLLLAAQRLRAEGDSGRAVALCWRAAAMARQTEQPEQEERALRLALEWTPDSARLHEALARHYLALTRYDAARSAFRRAIELEPDGVQAYLGLAESAVPLEAYDEALSALNRAVQLDPDDPDALWALAELFEETGIRLRAVTAYERFQERFPSDDRAREARQRAQRLTPPAPPEDAPPPEPDPVEPVEPPPPADPRPASGADARLARAAREAYQRGLVHQRRGDPGQAADFYQRAIDRDPSFAPPSYQLGVIRLEEGNYRAARSAFERSVALEPDNVNARYNLALALYELRALPESVTQLEAALRRDGDFAPAHLLLGIIHAGHGESREQARRHYQRFLQLRPEDPMGPSIREWLRRN
jgi:tetratricopeptide (TPR) repeat protein